MNQCIAFEGLELTDREYRKCETFHCVIYFCWTLCEKS